MVTALRLDSRQVPRPFFLVLGREFLDQPECIAAVQTLLGFCNGGRMNR